MLKKELCSLFWNYSVLRSLLLLFLIRATLFARSMDFCFGLVYIMKCLVFSCGEQQPVTCVRKVSDAF